MKKILQIILVLILFFSCRQIEKKDIIGEWNSFQYDSLEFCDLKFLNDKVLLIDKYSRVQSGDYIIKKNVLEINLKKYKLKSKIKFFNKDSIKLFNNIYYSGLNRGDFDIEEYDLIGFDNDLKLNSEMDLFFFHFYKKNKIEIRFNDKLIDFEDIPRAYYGSYHKTLPKIDFFIGENVELTDIKRLYYNLKNWNIDRIRLIVDKSRPKEYSYINDKIEIFDEDMEADFKLENISPVANSVSDKKSEFFKRNIQHIQINNKKDLKKLNSLNVEIEYLISIDKRIDLKLYLRILKLTNHLKRDKNFRIRKEIV